MNSITKGTFFQGTASKEFEDNLRGNVLEALRPEPGKGTQVRLVMGNCPYSSRLDDRTVAPPPPAHEILRKYSPTFVINASHACVFVNKHHFKNLRSPYRDAVYEMYQTICNTYEATILPVPNGMVQPRGTWPARMPLFVYRNGKLTAQDIFLTCTFEGVATTGGRSEACISLKGRVKGRGPLANVEFGKVSGNAHFDLEGGFVSRLKLITSTELEYEEKGVRVLINDESTVERTEGNSLGLSAPAPGPIAKDGPADRPAPDRPASPPPAAGLQGDLAALKGTWQSGEVNADGGGATGSLKLLISPSANRQGGRVKLEVATKRGGLTTNSSSTHNFTLSQKGDTRLIVATGLRGTGFVLSYTFEGDQLVVSGKVVSRRITYTLSKVALRKTSANPGDLTGGDSSKGGGNSSANAIKFTGNVHEFVQSAVQENRLADIDIRGFTLGSKYRDVSSEGGVLIGFQAGLGIFGQVGSLRPIFLTKKGEQFGKWQGKPPTNPITVKAKEGYVVSGMSIRTSTAIDNIIVTFAKLGKDGIDLSDTYKSDAVGAGSRQIRLDWRQGGALRWYHRPVRQGYVALLARAGGGAAEGVIASYTAHRFLACAVRLPGTRRAACQRFLTCASGCPGQGGQPDAQVSGQRTGNPFKEQTRWRHPQRLAGAAQRGAVGCILIGGEPASRLEDLADGQFGEDPHGQDSVRSQVRNRPQGTSDDGSGSILLERARCEHPAWGDPRAGSQSIASTSRRDAVLRPSCRQATRRRPICRGGMEIR